MSRRNILAGIVAVLVAFGCARLGLWQLDRHENRRAHNEQLASRRLAEPVPVQSLLDDPAARYRRVEAAGVFDYAHQIVLANRTRSGAPGVHVLTPLRLAGGAGVVMVNRGWLYSPDAARVDLEPWREADTVLVSGYVDALGEQPDRRAPAQIAPGVWYRPDSAALASTLPYSFPDLQLVASLVEPTWGQTPVRVGLPAMEKGPHLSYAFQWFAFGTIALVGGAVLILQDVRRRR